MLTHRLTNIKNMSRIMVLEDGRIIEQGTYAELTVAGGRFHKMVAER
jgi:ATP-binding cassette subfamily C protein CydD